LYCLTQEQQFAAQQKENEEKAIHQTKEQFQQKVSLMERQLTEQKQQVRDSESAKLSLVQLSLLHICVQHVHKGILLSSNPDVF